MTDAPASNNANGRLMRLASYVAVSVALVLIAAKLGAWLLTGSVALLSSLIDSVLDAFASIVALVAIRQALTPADKEHRFGHGKAEPIAALGQAAFIVGSALFLSVEAVRRLWSPQPVGQQEIGIAVMVFSILVTLALVAFQAHVIRRTGSLVVSADSLHYKGDLLINLSIIASLVLTGWFDFPLADPVFALGIAAYLLWNAKGIGGEALDMLMDRELPDEERRAILALARAHSGVLGVHDLRTRAAGPIRFIQMHLELDGDTRLAEAHAIADAVEAEIEAAFPGADVIVHQDPHGIPDAPREPNPPAGAA
ncbi:MAG: cation diffusion facilitator family transporter [Oceanibaculum nanhaiense]|nr:cation diffusion facilitator family transporter [Oceanibaculum nanhaiense]